MATVTLDHMAVVHGNVCNPVDVSSVAIAGATAIAWHPESNLKYEDRERMLKILSIAGSLTVTINLGATFSLSSWGIIGHNAKSSGFEIVLARGRLSSSYNNFDSSVTMDGDFDMAQIATTDDCDEVEIVFVGGPASNFYLGAIFLGIHTELDQNPSSGRHKVVRKNTINQLVDMGGARHMIFGTENRSQDLQMEFRRSKSEDLRLWTGLGPRDLIGIIPPLDHMAGVENGPKFTDHTFGYVREFSHSVLSSFGATQRRHNIVVSVTGM